MELLFKWFLKENAEFEIQWFAKNFSAEDFSGIDRLFYCYLSYCAYLSVIPTFENFNSYLKVDAKRDIREHNIRIDSLGAYDYEQTSQFEEACSAIIKTAVETYTIYAENTETAGNFKVDMYQLMSEKHNESIREIMIKAYPDLQSGKDIRTVSEDMVNSLKEAEERFNSDKLSELDLIELNQGEVSKNTLICKTGIPCIDGDIGGIYTHMIYTFNAQPGAGKTRFSLNYFTYQVLVNAKKDVLYYETELTRSQVENILIAIHIINLFGGKIKIPDTLMNKYDEMSDEQKQYYESARIDLFESGKYGKFIFKDDFIVETAEDEISAIVKKDPDIRLLVVDYMGLCKSKPVNKYERRKEGYQIITEGYEAIRYVLKKLPLAALCINQYNDKGIDAAYAGKQIRPGHVQGGLIVQRHTDYDLSMTFTEEQFLVNARTLSTSKLRGSAGFKNVLFNVDLSISQFKEVSKQAI